MRPPRALLLALLGVCVVLVAGMGRRPGKPKRPSSDRKYNYFSVDWGHCETYLAARTADGSIVVQSRTHASSIPTMLVRLRADVELFRITITNYSPGIDPNRCLELGEIIEKIWEAQWKGDMNLIVSLAVADNHQLQYRVPRTFFREAQLAYREALGVSLGRHEPSNIRSLPGDRYWALFARGEFMQAAEYLAFRARQGHVLEIEATSERRDYGLHRSRTAWIQPRTFVNWVFTLVRLQECWELCAAPGVEDATEGEKLLTVGGGEGGSGTRDHQPEAGTPAMHWDYQSLQSEAGSSAIAEQGRRA